MIALYRPMNIEVHERRFTPPVNVAREIEEAERRDYEEMCLGFDAYRRRRAFASLADFAVGLAYVACVVCYLWLFRVGE